MTWQEEVKQLIDIVLPTGRAEIAHIQKIFNIYNEHRTELIPGVTLNRETATHCSACVNRVITRLQTFLNVKGN